MNAHAAVVEKIGRLVKDGKTPLTADTSLIANNLLDSLGIFELIGFIEKEFEVRLDQEDMHPDNFSTVGTVVALVEKKLKGRR